MIDMEPIIEIVMSEMQTQIEDGVMKAVREIGVIIDKERLIKAVGKQTPRKIKVHWYRHTTCDCGYIFSKHHGDGYYSVPSTAKSNYCPYCGQALDWGDTDYV